MALKGEKAKMKFIVSASYRKKQLYVLVMLLLLLFMSISCNNVEKHATMSIHDGVVEIDLSKAKYYGYREKTGDYGIVDNGIDKIGSKYVNDLRGLSFHTISLKGSYAFEIFPLLEEFSDSISSIEILAECDAWNNRHVSTMLSLGYMFDISNLSNYSSLETLRLVDINLRHIYSDRELPQIRVLETDIGHHTNENFYNCSVGEYFPNLVRLSIIRPVTGRNSGVNDFTNLINSFPSLTDLQLSFSEHALIVHDVATYLSSHKTIKTINGVPLMQWCAINETPQPSSDSTESADQQLTAKYENAVEKYYEGQYSDAMELFETLPGDYKLTEIYLESISSIAEIDNGNWISAALLLYNLQQQCDEIPYDRELYQELFKLQFSLTERGTPGIDIVAYCIYKYYEEQIMLGNNITDLPDHPYRPHTDSNHYGLTINIDGVDIDVSFSLWCNMRVWNIKKQIKEQGLEYFFDAKQSYSTNQGAGISPVTITGSGIYIVDNMTKSDSYTNRGFSIDPFCYADTPETVRYILSLWDEYRYYGTYNNGTKGYTTVLFVTLTDVYDGEVLFARLYSAHPPSETSMNIYSDTYGKLDSSEITSDIKHALSEILIHYG